MNQSLNKFSAFTALLAASLLVSALPAGATNYAGNGDTSSGFHGAVANGVLSVTDDHTNITVNLQRGSSGNLDDLLVIYIDTGASGLTNTAGLTDTGGGTGDEQRAISGFDGSNRSLLVFTNGFRPSYAIAIKSDYMDVWSWANPASFSFLAGGPEGGNSSANFNLTFNCATLGLTANVPTTIRIFGTYVSNTGYRSTEAIAGNIVASSFGAGWHPFTNTAYGTYTFAPAAVPTYAVKFSVDMAGQTNAGTFVPGTDLVYCGGSFQTNPFAFNDFSLVRSNNSTIYTNTYPDADVTNTVETYKFKFHSVANNTDSYDADPNRTFILKPGGQVLPLIYFNNVPNSPSATTNYITFQIDMGPQIYLGHFNPGGGDKIELSGGFQSPQFAGGLILTNNPTAPNTNIYTIAFADHNYPGTQYLPPQNGYKYVIVTTSSTNFESGVNRSLVTVTNSSTLPLAYYNGVSTYASNAITFSVDMTVPIGTGLLHPGSDTVGCAGTFMTNQWAVGNVNSFLLTNNPTAVKSNIYSGTYIDRNAPGSIEYYKFVVNASGGGTTYESPSSTGGGDRIFLLGNSAATNPLVFWSDANPNQVLLLTNTVTFTVNMDGAVDVYGVPFNAGSDSVVINGDFATPSWNYYSGGNPPYFWTDPNFYISGVQSDYGPGSSYGQNYIMQDSGDGVHFTGVFTVPPGNNRRVTYRYGIHHNASSTTFDADNEVNPTNQINHVRYIRSGAAQTSYNFPTDIFGQQLINSTAAQEQAFGNLAIGQPASGHLPISWLGLPGVQLQTITNLMSTNWVNVGSTDGLNATNWPTGSGTRYFRLIQP